MTFENFEKTLDAFKEEGHLEGKKEGLLKGIAEGKKVGLQEGLEEGLKEGRKEGMLEGKEAAALEMLKDGVDLGKISQYTKLSSERVQALKSRL